MKIELYFSDYYGVGESVLEEYGAFNVSVVSDLPLFIDPFLLVRLDSVTTNLSLCPRRIRPRDRRPWPRALQVSNSGKLRSSASGCTQISATNARGH